MIFEDVMLKVLKWEGGYVNHPNDPGGETKFGITKRTYPNLDIKNLTREEAIDIYRRDFWDKYNIEQYALQHRAVMFDMAVNMGQRNAIRTLQRALGEDVDGIAGEKTKTAYNQQQNYSELSKKLLIERVDYYIRLTTSNPDRYTVFLRGWVRRALDMI